LVYSQDGAKEAMRSTLDNTPLGVFNGTFEGITDGVHYRSISVSSRKTRDIAVRFDHGVAVETVISPEDERTDLSVASAAPPAVIDPVATFGRFVNASGCPAAFRVYDGRRAVLVQPTNEVTNGTELQCEMSYHVTHGPGHLSPFYLKWISVALTYDVASKQSLRQLDFGAAGFHLTMKRTD